MCVCVCVCVFRGEGGREGGREVFSDMTAIHSRYLSNLPITDKSESVLISEVSRFQRQNVSCLSRCPQFRNFQLELRALPVTK